MTSEISKLLTMEHYGKRRKWLKIISTLNFWIDIFLIGLPLYIPYLFIAVAAIFGLTLPPDNKSTMYVLRLIGVIIAVKGLIGILREGFLSNYRIVGADFTQEQIREKINLLMDMYGWRGDCRVTVFCPHGSDNKTKPILKMGERIWAGHGPSESNESIAFFRKGQGIPGKAWNTAWSGEDPNALIDAIQIGNVPEQVLRRKDALRKFFEEKFGIVDDDIYEALGPKKLDIKSYMAVGILGRYQKLICVLAIDSPEENKFVDFEQLQRVGRGKLTEEEGFAIMGKEEPSEEGEHAQPDAQSGKLPYPEIVEELAPVLRKKMKDPGAWEKTKDLFKEITLIAHVAHSKEVRISAPGFIYALAWVLRQLRDVYLAEKGA